MNIDEFVKDLVEVTKKHAENVLNTQSRLYHPAIHRGVKAIIHHYDRLFDKLPESEKKNDGFFSKDEFREHIADLLEDVADSSLIINSDAKRYLIARINMEIVVLSSSYSNLLDATEEKDD